MSLPHPDSGAHRLNGNGATHTPTQKREAFLLLRRARAEAEGPHYRWQHEGDRWICHSLNGTYRVSAHDCECRDRQGVGRELGIPCKHMLALAAFLFVNSAGGRPVSDGSGGADGIGRMERIEEIVRQHLGGVRREASPFTRARVVIREPHRYGECHRDHAGWARLLPTGWVEFHPEAAFETHPGGQYSRPREDVRAVFWPAAMVARVEWLDERGDTPFDAERDHD